MQSTQTHTRMRIVLRRPSYYMYKTNLTFLRLVLYFYKYMRFMTVHGKIESLYDEIPLRKKEDQMFYKEGIHHAQ